MRICRQPHDFQSSLPGLTRQSILFEKTLAKVMDTRVKPAYDAVCGMRSAYCAGAYIGLICTLRNFTTPEPYCSANGPPALCFESCTSTVFWPFSTTTRCDPCP